VGGEAALIDPVLDHVDLYTRLVEALDLRLVFAVDTHAHTDHQSALSALRERTGCLRAMGGETRVEGVERRLSDGEVLDVDGLELEALHTPGHTGDSYSFAMDDRVFTGDTLLIGGTGRTDQGGDPRQQYDSLFSKLLALPGRTLVYPGHDYADHTVSSIAEERRDNPRLQVTSVDQYVALMEALRPDDPTHMDAVPRASLRPSGLFGELAALQSAS
jgi:glyoxylase-like metal-dependent hydrolase (beta-lactamase superfamily II)